jgi:hypothetical protein
MIMTKRDILVLGIIVLTIADIITTHSLVTMMDMTVEGNPLTRYMMGLGEWTWILFKSTITMLIILLIYRWKHKVRNRVLLVVNVLMLGVVANNAFLLVQLLTTHSDILR